MREIRHELSMARERIERLKGMTVRLRVNRGRNKVTDHVGKVRDNYAAVFTFEGEEGLMTFSYNDLLTKGIRIYKYEK